ncbi:hypothetical protein RI367_005952 [Sorochytrium milnesiophthora]
MAAATYPPSRTHALPCTVITKDNLAEHQQSIEKSILRASFVAVDLEFTGLTGGLRTQDMEERYKAVSRNAQDYALLAMGISVFIRDETDSQTPEGSVRWFVDNYNVLLQRQGSYTVSAKSLRFLATQGFDFQHQILSGVSYIPGTLKTDRDAPSETKSLRSIFSAILRSGAPVIFHNGFLDLVMLYHSFHAALPLDLDTFVADCSQMFAGGMFDTKLIAESKETENKSVLNYLFRKCERIQDQWRMKGRRCLLIEFCAPLQDTPRPAVVRSTELCSDFLKFGFCRRDLTCGLSHDVDQALDVYFAQKSNKRKRKTSDSSVDGVAAAAKKLRHDDNGVTASAATAPTSFAVTQHAYTPNADVNVTLLHSAHTDAFMTGYIFAHQLFQGWVSLDRAQSNATTDSEQQQEQPDLRNKVYLMGKNFPLLIRKSQFVQCSAAAP